MCDEAYEAYVNKCCFFGKMPTPREELERNEPKEGEDIVYDRDANRFVSVKKAKEFAKKAYEKGYADALEEVAS